MINVQTGGEREIRGRGREELGGGVGKGMYKEVHCGCVHIDRHP